MKNDHMILLSHHVLCFLLYAFRFLFLAFCSTLLALSSSLFFNADAAQPADKLRIALFPFENLTDDRTALTQIMPVIKDRLEKKGIAILDEKSLENFLLKERVRSTGYISKDLAQKMGKELNVKAILTGSVTSFYLLKNPQAGLLARLVDSSNGEILWASQASATGEDFTKMLGLGTVRSIDELIPIVVDRLFTSFSVTSQRKEKEQTHKIAVMLFQNKSKHNDAGIIITSMFLVELFKNAGYEPVEYGDIRKLTVDFRIRHRGELDYKNIGGMSEALGVDGIVVGTVELFSDGLDTSLPPEVAVSARLISAHKDRILWSDSIQLNGDEDIIVLDWGRIRAVDSVAYKVVKKLIQKMEKVKWQ
jgi:TolB-like protein